MVMEEEDEEGWTEKKIHSMTFVQTNAKKKNGGVSCSSQ